MAPPIQPIAPPAIVPPVQPSANQAMAILAHARIQQALAALSTRERKKMEKKAAQLNKRLCKSATYHELTRFNAHGQSHEKTRAMFTKFIHRVRTLFMQEYRVAHVLRNYPTLDFSNISLSTNRAIGMFFIQQIVPMTLRSLGLDPEEELDGERLLTLLYKTFASASTMDVSKSYNDLRNIAYSSRESIDVYTGKFARLEDRYRISLAALGNNAPPLTQVHLMEMYVTGILRNIQPSHSLWPIVQRCDEDIQSAMRYGTQLNFSFEDLKTKRMTVYLVLPSDRRGPSKASFFAHKEVRHVSLGYHAPARPQPQPYTP